MTKTELTNAINELDHQIKRLQDKREQLLNELVPLICPYKAGDRLERKTTRGYGSRKKDITEIWEITKTMPGWRVGEYDLMGKKVLKNGNLEKYEHTIYYNLDACKKVEKDR